MITNRVDDIFEQKDINVLLQNCNLECSFGAGIAKIIKQKFPEAYKADLATVKGDISKLGTFSSAKSGNMVILNCYCMPEFGETSYDAFWKVLNDIEKRVAKYNDINPDQPKIIGIPYGICAGLAKARWPIIETMIKEVFENSPVEVVIVRLPSQPEID